MCLNRIARCLFTAAILCLAALTAAPAMAEGDGRLTTHVLDTMIGKPGVGMRIDFSVQEGAGYRLIRTLETILSGGLKIHCPADSVRQSARPTQANADQ